MDGEPLRWARATIDPDAVVANVRYLATTADPAELWAVVKANGYGHGAATIARLALEAGATRCCVALVQEAVELRAAGIRAPIVILTEQPPEQLPAALDAGVELAVYSHDALHAIEAVAGGRSVGVHMHVDTGMSRVGVQPAEAVDLARAIDASDAVYLAGVMTHFACADEPANPATLHQLESFTGVLAALTAANIDPGIVHAANSAATLAFPQTRFGAVRCGIAVYGLSPGDGVDDLAEPLRPVMELRARVSFVKRVEAGTHVSYGWRYVTERATTLVTIPIGYADGVPRALGSDRSGAPGFAVLIGGRRLPIAGVVTMDQLVVDVGDVDVSVGDEVVLLGRQGDEVIRVVEWAGRLDTIGYEIVCGIGSRVPRVVQRSP